MDQMASLSGSAGCVDTEWGLLERSPKFERLIVDCSVDRCMRTVLFIVKDVAVLVP